MWDNWVRMSSRSAVPYDGPELDVLRGRCNSEPAVTVRDPAALVHPDERWRLTWWNSRTDGESPDGRMHAAEAADHGTRRRQAGARSTPLTPDAAGGEDDRDG